MADKTVIPSLGAASFSCPHAGCGALAHQSWYEVHAKYCLKDAPPQLLSPEIINEIKSDTSIEKNKKIEVVEHAELVLAKEIILLGGDNRHQVDHVENLFISVCYSCNKCSVWHADRLIYPEQLTEIEPHEDMPDDVRVDFLEAASIVDKSPRGAAALARLCLQKLMGEIGQKGKDLNTDIGELVKQGLDKRIQQTLDIVRVTGNNAVHPGQIDLKDDKETAVELLRLINIGAVPDNPL